MNIAIYYKDHSTKNIDNCYGILEFKEKNMTQIMFESTPGVYNAVNVQKDEIARIHIKGEH